jgi:hypothetical protein
LFHQEARKQRVETLNAGLAAREIGNSFQEKGRGTAETVFGGLQSELGKSMWAV